MKRFMVFAGSHYYPSGGMHDFASSHDTRDEARAAAKKAVAAGETGIHFNDWAHVYDSETGAWWDEESEDWTEEAEEV